MTNEMMRQLLLIWVFIFTIGVFIIFFKSKFPKWEKKKQMITIVSLIVVAIVSFSSVFAVLKIGKPFDTPEEAFHGTYLDMSIILCVRTDEEAFIIYKSSSSGGISFTCIPKEKGEWVSVSPSSSDTSVTNLFGMDGYIGVLHTLKSKYSSNQFNVIVCDKTIIENEINIIAGQGNQFVYDTGNYVESTALNTYYYLVTEGPLLDDTVIINGERITLTA